jgi:uncharacterized protein (DUF169 family)
VPSIAALASQLTSLLGLSVPPISLSFSETPPAGVARVSAAAPAGCSYWRRAAEGEVFTTAAADHLGCPIGAYTHGAEMVPELRGHLERMLNTMAGLGYLSLEEVPAIPARTQRLAWVTYGPLERAPVAPDIVLVRSEARAAMLLSEAVHSAGLRDGDAWMIRPACAVVPKVLSTSRLTVSAGCVGNRVYTGLGDSEMWSAAPGSALRAIVENLRRIIDANDELEAMHRGRLHAAPAI